jgi:hypothetical protein
MPTANPARTNRSQSSLEESELFINAASASKNMMAVITCGDMPQQAVEKKVEFNIIAPPPKTQAEGDNPDCRKKSHAARPSIHSDNTA